MMSILSLIDIEITVHKVLQEFHVGLSKGMFISYCTVMPIPPPKVILTIPDNKRQLINDDLCSNTVFPETQNIRRLVVTGEDLFLWN